MGVRLAAASVCLLIAWGCRSSLPPERARLPAGSLFAGAESREDLTRQLGAEPERCLPLDRDRDICEWRVAGHHPRHEDLSGRLGVPDDVGVLCVLLATPQPLEEESCWLQQRRSNRDRFNVAEHAQPRLSAEAVNEVRAARTLLEMTWLLGELPQQCVARGEVERVCEWRLTRQSYGHGTAARVIGAKPRRQIRWLCRFPLDGGGRPPRSCSGRAL